MEHHFRRFSERDQTFPARARRDEIFDLRFQSDVFGKRFQCGLRGGLALGVGVRVLRRFLQRGFRFVVRLRAFKAGGRKIIAVLRGVDILRIAEIGGRCGCL